MPERLHIYWKLRPYLSTMDRVLLYDKCVVVPKNLRNTVIEVLHSAHQGVTAMSLRSNSSVYWPGMYTDIVAKRSNCAVCHSIAPSQFIPWYFFSNLVIFY